MVASIRCCMDVPIVQHTDMTFPQVEGVDVQRLDIPGDHIERRWSHLAHMEGEVISLDCDVLVKRDLSHVFAKPFDVAMCRTPDREDRVFNAGVIFSRNPEFWREVLRVYKALPSPDGWEDSQRAITKVADSGKFMVLELPFDEYNFTPTGPGQGKDAAIVHYRGLRKKFMSLDCGESDEVAFPILGFESGLNTPTNVMIEQARVNLARDVPTFIECPENGNKALLVGGGPSLKRLLPNLRMQIELGAVVFSMNGTHDYLIERGILPDFHVMLDARPENVRFVQKPHRKVTYLVATQCHPSVFEVLRGYDVVMWTAVMDYGIEELANEFPQKMRLSIGGGATVGLKTMMAVHLMGFRTQHLYGFDSSYEGEQNHAYRQDLNDKESRIEVTAAGRKFICAPWMAKQAQEFQWTCRMLENEGSTVYVHGDGLIPWVAQQLQEAA